MWGSKARVGNLLRVLLNSSSPLREGVQHEQARLAREQRRGYDLVGRILSCGSGRRICALAEIVLKRDDMGAG